MLLFSMNIVTYQLIDILLLIAWIPLMVNWGHIPSKTVPEGMVFLFLSFS